MQPVAGSPTFIKSILPSLDEPALTFNLKNSTEATMELGRIDLDQTSGSLHKLPVESQGAAWTVKDISFSVNGTLISVRQEALSFGMFLDHARKSSLA